MSTNNNDDEQSSNNEDETPRRNSSNRRRQNRNGDMRAMQRAVAEREASRLARPDRPLGDGRLGHASKKRSAVSSTPFGVQGRSMATAVAGSGGDGEGAGEEEWCGPFSVARQMIRAREEARQKREAEQEQKENKENGSGQHPLDAEMAQVELEKKRKLNPSMNWSGKNNQGEKNGNVNFYVKRQRRLAKHRNRSVFGVNGTGRVPTLFQLCVDLLVDNFESVEALGFVDSSIRRAICESLVAKGKMNGAAFDAIAEVGIEDLELVDCVGVTQTQLSETLAKLIPSGLRALILNNCGRCFGPAAVQSIINSHNSSSSSTSSSLFALSIGGAYLLKDSDGVLLIDTLCSGLSSISFKACPLLGTGFCKSIGRGFASEHGGGELLELVLQDISLSKEALMSLVSSDALRNLKNISLRQIESIDDDVVSTLLASTVTTTPDSKRGGLESIDLSLNASLTDDCLSSIRKCNVNGTLRALALSGVNNLTSAGLETLFTKDIEGFGVPPALKKLDLSGLGKDSLSDAVVELAAACSFSSKKNEDGCTAAQLKSYSSEDKASKAVGLVYVNLNGGSQLTNKSMEALAATSALSLEELDVSFCPRIKDQGLGYLVSKAGTQLSKVSVWGCAQITDEFLDGHDRVEEGGLEIAGVWMKEGGRRSVV